MSTEHPRTHDIEQIPVKKPTVEALQTYLWNEINKDDIPPGELMDHGDELNHAQGRHENPGFYDGDLVVANDGTTGPAELWRVTGCTHTEKLDDTPTVIYHVESPANQTVETTFDPEHLTAADEFEDEFITPTREE